MKIIFSILILITSTAFSFSQTALQQAKSLEENGQESEALNKYLEVLKTDTKNYNLVCKVSFLYSRVGNRITDKAKQAEYFKLAKQYAEQALQINPNDAESNYVMAVAVGRMALIAGTKERVAASRDIKIYVDNALKYNPAHAAAWNLLGLWHYKMANLNFAEIAAANALFGGIPKGASNEKAVECFKKAIQYDPTYIFYYLDLGNVYYTMGEKENALKAVDKGLGIPNSKNPDDPQYKKELQALKDKIVS